MSTLLILFLGFLFSIFSLKYISNPYIFASLFWLSLLIILILRSKTVTKKAIWSNLAFTVLLLGSLETQSYHSLSTQENETGYRYEGEYRKGFSSPHPILRYGPTKHTTITSTKYLRDQLIYDVTYTIGNDGRRITPTVKIPDQECIVCFGGSFTFGEGVNDPDSMPYIVGDLQSLKVHNYGFHGYGPHQMLSAIESDLIDCKPKLVIYQAIVAHVARSAGYSSWDKHGPKYLLRNGRITFDGHFDDQNTTDSWYKRKAIAQMKKSHIYRRFFLGRNRFNIADCDIQLFLKIVDASRTKLSQSFPEGEFHVILWDKEPDDATYLKVRNGLKSLSIEFHLVSEILPNFSEDAGRYEIGPHDTHPNSVAHRAIAEYVVDNLLGYKRQSNIVD